MDWYFLFSPDNMPLGVWRTETPEESEKLFCRLYRRSMEDMAKDGIYMKKEQDVPASMWEEIHTKYQQRKNKDTKPAILPKLTLNRNCDREPTQPTQTIQLETERFMRLHLRR